jgi:hypothetical protein
MTLPYILCVSSQTPEDKLSERRRSAEHRHTMSCDTVTQMPNYASQNRFSTTIDKESSRKLSKKLRPALTTSSVQTLML